VASAASASGAQAAAHTAAQAAACTTAQLDIWYGEPAGAAAGSTYIPLEFSNTGTTACTLDGFPGVSAVNADGAQIGSSATWNHVIEPSAVVLAPGGTAHLILQTVDVANYSPPACDPTPATGLRIYPPNQTGSVVLRIPFEACAKTGANFLGVDPVSAGVGIPFSTNT
jgi:hypothetical protein